MKILFYADTGAADGDRLLQKIEDQISADVLKAYRSLDGFKQGLLRQKQKPKAVILFAANAAELKLLITMGKLLTDVRILLVLPDRCKETVAAGHRLWPRYISYADSDFGDVVAVVRQILKLSPAHEAREENEGRRTREEGRETKDERRRTREEGRRTRDEVSSIVIGSEANGRPASIVKK